MTYNFWRHHGRVIILAVISMLVLSFCLVNNSSAIQDNTKINQKGLTLSPLKTEINIYPGTSKTGKLTISNYTTKQMQVNLDSEAFSVINRQYDYKFTIESNAAKWVAFETQSLSLAPGASKDVGYSLNVPVSAEPGGQYFSIFASTDTISSDTAITSKQRIASLLYITVMGDVTRTGRLISLNSPWFVNENNMWAMSIQNTGSAHFRSKYKLKVLDFFGNEVAANPISEYLILPGTVRDVSGLVPLPQYPGIYKLSYNISLGDSPSKTEIKYMFYSPLWFLICLIILVFAVVIVFAEKIKKSKR